MTCWFIQLDSQAACTIKYSRINLIRHLEHTDHDKLYEQKSDITPGGWDGRYVVTATGLDISQYLVGSTTPTSFTIYLLVECQSREDGSIEDEGGTVGDVAVYIKVRAKHWWDTSVEKVFGMPINRPSLAENTNKPTRLVRWSRKSTIDLIGVEKNGYIQSRVICETFFFFLTNRSTSKTYQVE